MGRTSATNPRTWAQGFVGPGTPSLPRFPHPPRPGWLSAVTDLRLKIFPDSRDSRLHLPITHGQPKRPQPHRHVTPLTQLGELPEKEAGRLTLLDGAGVPAKLTLGADPPTPGGLLRARTLPWRSSHSGEGPAGHPQFLPLQAQGSCPHGGVGASGARLTRPVH